MRWSKAVNICKHETHPVVVFDLMWIVIDDDSLSIVLRIICIHIWVIETDIKFCVLQILICVFIFLMFVRTHDYVAVWVRKQPVLWKFIEILFKISLVSMCHRKIWGVHIAGLYSQNFETAFILSGVLSKLQNIIAYINKRQICIFCFVVDFDGAVLSYLLK
jgi:hypothetical protein